MSHRAHPEVLAYWRERVDELSRQQEELTAQKRAIEKSLQGVAYWLDIFLQALQREEKNAMTQPPVEG